MTTLEGTVKDEAKSVLGEYETSWRRDILVGTHGAALREGSCHLPLGASPKVLMGLVRAAPSVTRLGMFGVGRKRQDQ